MRRSGAPRERDHRLPPEAGTDGGAPAEGFVVALNFSDAWVEWPKAGRWEEQIDKADNSQAPLQVPADGDVLPVHIPSNYGAVYMQTQG
ncbi:UNVERIFIED_ORG: hypothetical protein J2X79_004265 [Arthrobacter globiformis]|nr:hypothetical protein [Arthrobacter globiformis]